MDCKKGFDPLGTVLTLGYPKAVLSCVLSYAFEVIQYSMLLYIPDDIVMDFYKCQNNPEITLNISLVFIHWNLKLYLNLPFYVEYLPKVLSATSYVSCIPNIKRFHPNGTRTHEHLVWLNG